MTETRDIVGPTLRALNRIPGVICLRLQAGTVRARGGFVRGNAAGTPDLLAIVRGSAIFMEAKMPRMHGERGGVLSKEQHAFIRRAYGAEADWLVITSPKDAIDVVKGYLR